MKTIICSEKNRENVAALSEKECFTPGKTVTGHCCRVVNARSPKHRRTRLSIRFHGAENLKNQFLKAFIAFSPCLMPNNAHFS